MIKARSKLTEDEIQAVEDTKRKITMLIKYLKENGVRDANIEIELVWHIKKELRGE